MNGINWRHQKSNPTICANVVYLCIGIVISIAPHFESAIASSSMSCDEVTRIFGQLTKNEQEQYLKRVVDECRKLGRLDDENCFHQELTRIAINGYKQAKEAAPIVEPRPPAARAAFDRLTPDEKAQYTRRVLAKCEQKGRIWDDNCFDEAFVELFAEGYQDAKAAKQTRDSVESTAQDDIPTKEIIDPLKKVDNGTGTGSRAIAEGADTDPLFRPPPTAASKKAVSPPRPLEHLPTAPPVRPLNPKELRRFEAYFKPDRGVYEYLPDPHITTRPITISSDARNILPEGEQLKETFWVRTFGDDSVGRLRISTDGKQLGLGRLASGNDIKVGGKAQINKGKVYVLTNDTRPYFKPSIQALQEEAEYMRQMYASQIGEVQTTFRQRDSTGEIVDFVRIIPIEVKTHFIQNSDNPELGRVVFDYIYHSEKPVEMPRYELERLRREARPQGTATQGKKK